VRELLADGRWRVGLVAILVGTIGWSIWRSAEERERVRLTRQAIAETRRAIALFREEWGRCPHSLRELVNPSRAGRRYLRERPVDGWGHPLWVRCPGRYDPDDIDVVSAGPSGNFLVDDNIQ
jgi:hypothetical protein